MQSYKDYHFVMQVSVICQRSNAKYIPHIGSTRFRHWTACLAVTFQTKKTKKRTALLWFPQKQQWDNLKIHTRTHPVGKYMR